MYVLHHADKPHIYSDLPDNPKISPVVKAWKGVTKTAGLAAMGLAAVAAVAARPVRRGPTASGPRTRSRRAKRWTRGTGRTAMSDPEPIERGDEILPGNPPRVVRYRAAARINHWITATAMVLLVLSGLSMFHPSLFFLTGLFGGGQTHAGLHPWFGLVLVAELRDAVRASSGAATCGTAATWTGWPTSGTSCAGARRRCRRSASTTPARSSSSG